MCLFRKLRVVFILCLVLFTSISISSNKSLSNPIQKEPVYDVGVLVSYGGESKAILNSFLDGILAATAFVNASDDFDFNINLIIEDSGTDYDSHIKSYQNLKTKGVQLIIGPAESSTAIDIAKLAKMDKIVLNSFAATAPNIQPINPTKNNFEYFFRVDSSEGLKIRALASLIYKLNLKNLIVIYNNDTFSDNSFSRLKEQHELTFKELGGNIVEEINYFGKANSSAIVNEIENQASINSMTIIDNNLQNILNIYNETRLRGINLPFFALLNTIENNYSVQLKNLNLDNFYSADSGGGNPGEKAYDLFIERLQSCNKIGLCSQGIVPKIYEEYAYDAMNVGALAIKSAGIYNGEAIKHSMDNAGSRYIGVTGNKSFTQYGDPEYYRINLNYYNNNQVSTIGNWSLLEGIYLDSSLQENFSAKKIDVIQEISIFLFLVVICLLLLTIILKKKKKSNIFAYFDSFDRSIIEQLYRKITGIANEVYLLQNPKITKTNDITNSEHLSHVSRSIIINVFPNNFYRQMKYNLNGRTILIFIELAFQRSENTNSTFIGNILNISNSTLSKDIHKLLQLGLIEYFYSEETLRDSRTRFFRITKEGILFLEFLKEAITISLKKYEL